MGRMKDIAIGLMTQPDQECPNDEELRVLMDNFKPTAEELQAELDELQAQAMSLPSITLKPEYKVFLLMKNGYPFRSYTDRALAFYECWVCVAGEEREENPDDWYVVEVMHDESIYTGE